MTTVKFATWDAAQAVGRVRIWGDWSYSTLHLYRGDRQRVIQLSFLLYGYIPTSLYMYNRS